LVADANLTERQQKYFASLRASLERETGKSLAEWVAIARTCPEAGHRARLNWFKAQHGLLQNRASLVLGEAFASSSAWDQPEALIDAVWQDAASRALFEVIDRAASALEGTVRTARKGYTAWSRQVQFAAARPLKDGGAMLGLAAPLTASARLEPTRSETWSERLVTRVRLASTAEVDAEIRRLLEIAWLGA
jgi:hypothetical protein